MPRSTRSFLFPDVNVWIALTYAGHIHHYTASEWFRGLAREARLCFCRFTQIGMLRLLTTEAVMGTDEVMTQRDAWRAYDRWMADGRILFLEEPPTLADAFRSLSSEAHPHPKDWADAYLAAFATVSGMRLVTFDRAFHRKLDDVLILSQ